MIRAGVDLQLVQLLPREAVPREHALDRLADHFGRPALELVARASASAGRPDSRNGGSRACSSSLLPVTVIFSALTTTTKSPVSTCGVYCGFVLPRSVSAIWVAKPTKGLALGVNDVPAALDLARLCVPGLLHGNGGLDVRRPRIVATRCETPRLRRGWDGGRTPLLSQLRRRGRLRARRRPRASCSRKRLADSISARVGRLFAVSVPGWVGTAFQHSVSSSSSSSASVARTISRRSPRRGLPRSADART